LTTLYDQVIVILLQTGNAGNMSQAFKEAKKYFKSSNEVAGIYKANILPNVAFSVVSMKTVSTNDCSKVLAPDK
jgi:preprotein translocase subunit SecG